MRLFKPLLLAVLMLFPWVMECQITAPQINLSGNIGCQGFPCLNNGTLIMADANHTMTAQETSALYIKVVSSVPWTAARTLNYPSGRFPAGIENASTGGYSLNVCAPSGACVTIANSSTSYTPVWNDGTNFVSGAGSGGSITIPGSNGSILFNNSGALGATSDITTNGLGQLTLDAGSIVLGSDGTGDGAATFGGNVSADGIIDTSLSTNYLIGTTSTGQLTGHSNVTTINGTSCAVGGSCTVSGGGATLAGDVTGPSGSNTVVAVHATSGTVDGVTIGATTPSTGGFTSITANNLNALPVQEYQTTTNPGLEQWLLSMHGATVAATHIAIIGDSQMKCWNNAASCGVGPTISTNRVSERLRIGLQGVFGSNGTGMIPAMYSVGDQTHFDPQYYATTGTWSYVNTLGPYQGSVTPGSSLAMANSGTVITFNTTIPFDTWETECMVGPAGTTNAWTVAANGTTFATHCGDTNTTNIARLYATATGLSSATPTITLTCTATPCYFAAGGGSLSTTGISVDDWAAGSASTAFFGSAASTQMAFIDLIPPSIAIINLETNDLQQSISPANTTTYLNAIITNLKALSPVPSIFILIPPVSNIGNVANFPATTAAIIAVARTNNIPFLNIQDQWGLTPNCTSGHWDSSSECVHPGDAGAGNIEGMLKAGIVDSLPLQPSGSGSGTINTGTANAIPTYIASGTTIGPSLVTISPGTSPVIAATCTGSGCSDGFSTTVPLAAAPGGSNTMTFKEWADGNGAGLPGVWGLYNSTSSGFAFAINSANNDLFGVVPVTNVSAGTGAVWSILHTGAASFANGVFGTSSSTGTSVTAINNDTSTGALAMLNYGSPSTGNGEPLSVGAAPNLASGTYAFNILGKDTTITNNSFAGIFGYASSGSAANRFWIGANVPGGLVGNPGEEFCSDGSFVIGATAAATCITGYTLTVLGSTNSVSYTETLTTPSSSSATCTAGQFTDDANFHYVCVATNTWKRGALTTF